MALRYALSALAAMSFAASATAKTPPVKRNSQQASSAAARGGDNGFHLDRLPQGKNVTIPRPATTFVPLSSSINLTATDTPQTVSLKPINLKTGGLVSGLRVSIMDRESGKLQYIELQPGLPFLYNFKDLGSITVIPQASGVASQGLSLQVESDKPLEIAH